MGPFVFYDPDQGFKVIRRLLLHSTEHGWRFNRSNYTLVTENDVPRLRVITENVCQALVILLEGQQKVQEDLYDVYHERRSHKKRRHIKQAKRKIETYQRELVEFLIQAYETGTPTTMEQVLAESEANWKRLGMAKVELLEYPKPWGGK